MEASEIVMIVLNGGIIIIHCFCLYLLCRISQLRQNHFVGLVMCLSISDMVIGIGACFTVYLSSIVYNPDNRIYCLLMMNFIGRGSMIFSIFQRLQICMGQLNATFVTKRNILTALESYKATVVGLAFTFLYSTLWFAVDNFVLTMPCDRNYAISLWYFVSRDLPGFLLMSVMVGSYGVIVFRVIRIMHRHKHLTQRDGQKFRQNEHLEAQARRTITLLIVVGLTIMSYLPRMLFVLSKVVSRDELSQDMYSVFTTVTLMSFINPLLDPFIYVFRLEKVKETLLCCKRNPELN